MNSSSSTDAAAAGVVGGMVLMFVVIGLAVCAFLVWMFWRIFAKTGMNPALGLLCLIPSVGPLICLLLLAFSRWPMEDAVAAAHPGGYVPPPAPGTSVMPT